MNQTLFKQAFTLNQTAHQAHLVYRVYVPANAQAVFVKFHYSPVVETDLAVITKTVVREGLPKSVVNKDTFVRNLLTISVNDPDVFRGSHHFFGENQEIEIGEETATEGFMPGSLKEGFWEFIINCHGVFSEKVTGELTVQCITENRYETERVPSVPLGNLSFEPKRKERDRDSAVSYEVKRLELHTHTVHSDADQTTEQLLEQAEKEEIDWLAITDHNTYTACVEAKKQKLFGKNIHLLHGIEYTTFYGHFLVHGELKDLNEDWTKISKTNLASFLKKVKERDTYVTIAHPFDSGNPFCTGCRWDYLLQNVDNVDAIEVWNGTNPHQSLSNEDAFFKWTLLLAQGHELAAASGRDWHRFYPGDEIAYTYAYLPQNAKEEDVRKSLALGRSYVSLRPEIDFLVNDFYMIGDRIKEEANSWNVSLAVTNLKGGDEIRVYSERKMIFQETITNKEVWKKQLCLLNEHYQLLRVEILNKQKERVAFTNPIYIHR